MYYDVIVIGGGPAGLTAATYIRRAGKTVLIIEKNSFGGQIVRSPKVENFPGFVSISGAELGDRLLEQALSQGADAELEEVVAVELSSDKKTVLCLSSAKYEAAALIIATGAKPRPLGLSGEERLSGNGVCYCSICDGSFFKGQDVAVVGGGNSALQDAMLLSEICSHVYLVHRRSSFRGETALVEALRKKPNVELVLDSVPTELVGEDELSALTVMSGDEQRTIPISGLFVAVGRVPDTEQFSKLLPLDAAGYALCDENCIGTADGIFVAGDCRAKTVRQLTTAVADGSVAAVAACEWLDKKHTR